MSKETRRYVREECKDKDLYLEIGIVKAVDVDAVIHGT